MAADVLRNLDCEIAIHRPTLSFNNLPEILVELGFAVGLLLCGFLL